MSISGIEKIYVYCHNCKKLIFKGPLDEAVKISCHSGHQYTCGKLIYFENVFHGVIDTSTWDSLHPKKGQLINVRGNVCEPQRINGSAAEYSVIPQCCNTKGVMGAGVALSLKKKWPSVAERYTSIGAALLGWMGQVLWEPIEGKKIAVVNMVAQKGTCTDLNNPKPVKYWALLDAMRNTLDMINQYVPKDQTPVFHCPKFGSDLAGGNWDVILELIKEVWIDAGFDVVVYDFEPDKAKWGIVG